MRWKDCAVVACWREFRLRREIAPDELVLAHREIGQHQSQRLADGLQPAPRVFAHDVDLQHPLLIVVFERLIVAGFVFLAFRSGRQTDAHRGAEHGQSLLEDDGALFVKIHQRPLDRSVEVLDF